MKRLALLPLLAFVFACNDSQPLAPDDDLAPQFSAAGAPVQTASGSGHRKGDWYPDLRPGRSWGRTFAFNAKKWADQSVTGQWERKNKWPQETDRLTGHGVITCMTIIGNAAYLGGYATSGLGTEYPTSECPECTDEVFWYVVDNGQGSNDPPDMIGFQYVGMYEDEAQWFCDNIEEVIEKGWLPTAFPVEAGNIKVNG